MTRYAIFEWYGQPLQSLPVEERHALAMSALGEADVPVCPFRPGLCSKKGGVCSMRAYERDGEEIGPAVGHPVIMCPSRFDQDMVLVEWLSELVGFPLNEVEVAREVPFMRNANTQRHAGKIDLVLAKSSGRLEWIGLEIQAVYFSGMGMQLEFEQLLWSKGSSLPYPVHHRRPDWRSSSAKRLLPQLQVKVPTLVRWQSKMAVAVDRPFFEAIGGPSLNPSHDLDSGDVVWLVPELVNNDLRRWHWEVLTLEASVKKLLSAEQVSRKDFESLLRTRLTPLQSHQSDAQ